MRKWESEYQNYKNGKYDRKIRDLNRKMKNRTITKDELETLKNFEKIKGNIEKVTNILELRYKLLKQEKEIKDELARISKEKDLQQEIKKLEEKRVKNDRKQDDIMAELKNPNLSEQDKKAKTAELQKLKLEMQENNHNFAENHKNLLANQKTKNLKFSVMNEEDLKKKAFDIGTKISKCNMVGNNLMKGLSWDNIELKLENWDKKKLKSSEKITDKVDSLDKNKTPKNVEKNIDLDKLGDKIVEQTEKQFSREDLKNLIEADEFTTKHPRLVQIRNFFKDRWNGIKNIFRRNNDNMKKNTDKKDVAKEQEENIPEKTETKRDEFTKYLRDVAEKGMQATGKEKLEQAKQQAYKRETEKYGKDYAEKSYHMEDEKER